MVDDDHVAVRVLGALHFAADKHRDQRRKGVEASPHINHPIEVAEFIARKGRVTDPVVLQAAILHDTLEDTETTRAELETAFGEDVTRIVLEVTDDKELPKDERKRIQVAHAERMSDEAKLVKLGDKIANVRAVAHAPVSDWTVQHRREYLDWAERVVAGCRGRNAALEGHFDEVIAAARERIVQTDAARVSDRDRKTRDRCSPGCLEQRREGRVVRNADGAALLRRGLVFGDPGDFFPELRARGAGLAFCAVGVAWLGCSSHRGA